ncbi:hypothetical protein E3N88_20991 [Mikania micrantha]|uniref:Tf2-1-like SH3-like domain-containing protein n=1 Tax=Mikania micrantha TaxID=192012 RepID=A0A5N6NLD9_9ASTR|nr:hypothetical protein E3N88_20991 [Mikania micrantha]
MVMDKPTNWIKWLPLAEFCYSCNFHTPLGITLFQALYGYPPPIFVPYVPKDVRAAAVNELLCDREATIKLLRFSLTRAQNRMKQLADKRRSDREFRVGDYVYVKLHPYAVAYKLDLPDEAQVHSVFHVSLLKLARGNVSQAIPLPTGPRFLFKPLQVLKRRLARSYVG